MTESLSVELSHRQDYRHALGQNSPFYKGLEVGELVGSSCRQCGSVFMPPRATCLIDGSATDWIKVGDTGTLIGFTKVARRPSYAANGPDRLTLGLVQLDGAVTAILAEVVDQHAPEVGQRVHAIFRPATTHPIQRLSFAATATAARDQQAHDQEEGAP